MKAGLVLALTGVALAAVIAWAKPPGNTRDLVRPKSAPLVTAAGKVSFSFTSTGRVLDFRFSGLDKRTRYAVRFNQDDHPVLRAARTDRKGRAKIHFGAIHLPMGILEPIANRPIEVVAFKLGIPGDQVLVGRVPIIDGFPYWGQSVTGGNGTGSRLPGVDGTGPLSVESATFASPSVTGDVLPGSSTIWYPGHDGIVTAGGPYPPVVFVHAVHFGASDYQNWGQKIASWGFVVTMLDQPDAAATDGQTEVRATIDAMKWLIAENGDPSSRLFGQLDVQKFGFVGHGRGGGAAIIAAAHSATQGRVKAAVGLGPEALSVQSGLFGEFIPYLPDTTSGFWPPTLVLSGTQDGFVDPAASRAAYFAIAPRPRGVAQVEGHCNTSYADHVPAAAAAVSDFDAATCESPESQQAVARTYVIPWLLFHLRGDTRVTEYVDGTFAAEQVNVVEESFD